MRDYNTTIELFTSLQPTYHMLDRDLHHKHSKLTACTANKNQKQHDLCEVTQHIETITAELLELERKMPCLPLTTYHQSFPPEAELINHENLIVPNSLPLIEETPPQVPGAETIKYQEDENLLSFDLWETSTSENDSCKSSFDAPVSYYGSWMPFWCDEYASESDLFEKNASGPQKKLNV